MARKLSTANQIFRQSINEEITYIQEQHFDDNDFEIFDDEAEYEYTEENEVGKLKACKDITAFNEKNYIDNTDAIEAFLQTIEIEKNKKSIAQKISPKKNQKIDEINKHLQWMKDSKADLFVRIRKESDRRRIERVQKNENENEGKRAKNDDDCKKGGWAHNIEVNFLKKELLFNIGVTETALKMFKLSKSIEISDNFDDNVPLCPKHVCVIRCIMYVTKAIEDTIALCFSINQNPVVTDDHMTVLENRGIRIKNWNERIDRMKFFQYILVSAKEFNTTFSKYKKELQKKLKVMEWNIQSLKKRQSDSHHGADFGLDPNPNSAHFNETIRSILLAHSLIKGEEDKKDYDFKIDDSASNMIMELTMSYILGLCEDAMTFNDKIIGRISGAMIRSMADVYNPRNPATEERLVVQSNMVDGRGHGVTIRLPETRTNAKHISLNVQKIRGHGIAPFHLTPPHATLPHTSQTKPKPDTKPKKATSKKATLKEATPEMTTPKKATPKMTTLKEEFMKLVKESYFISPENMKKAEYRNLLKKTTGKFLKLNEEGKWRWRGESSTFFLQDNGIKYDEQMPKFDIFKKIIDYEINLKEQLSDLLNLKENFWSDFSREEVVEICQKFNIGMVCDTDTIELWLERRK